MTGKGQSDREGTAWPGRGQSDRTGNSVSGQGQSDRAALGRDSVAGQQPGQRAARSEVSVAGQPGLGSVWPAAPLVVASLETGVLGALRSPEGS